MLEFVHKYQKFGIALLFGIICILILIAAWSVPAHRYGDSSTYFLQIASLAEDGDIRYTEADFKRIPGYQFDDLPAGMELIKNSQGIYFYGKEFTYALFAAPFFAMGGNNAILVFNGLLFFFMIAMGYLVLREENGIPLSLIFSLLFFTLSTAVIYIFWVSPEIYAMFILMASLFFMSLAYRSREIRTISVAGILFGIAAVVRPWNLFFFIPFLLNELYRKQWKRSIIMGVSFAIPVLIIILPLFAATGTVSFYGGDRFYYSQGPYPFGEDFSYGDETKLTTLDNTLNYLTSNPVQSFIPDNFLYILTGYFVGRFTGIFWYYPFTLFAILSLLVFFAAILMQESSAEDRSRTDWKILVIIGIVTSIFFIFVIRGWGNYFGGTAAVGNRYFTIYPAFLFLFGRIDPKKVLLFGLIALVLVVPVITDPVGTSQDISLHAGKFPYTLFPIEYPSMGSLPLRYVFYSPELWMIQLPSEPKTEDELFLIENGTQLYLISKKEVSNVSFMISAVSGGRVTLSAGGDTRVLSLRPEEPQLLTFKNPPVVYREPDYFIYAVSIIPETRILIFPFSVNNAGIYDVYYINWYPPEDWENKGIITRWMNNNGTIAIVVNESVPATLSFELISFYHPRTVRISSDNHVVREVRADPGFNRFEIPLGEKFSIVRFTAEDGSERPVDIPDLNNKDTRNLSVAIRNVSISGISTDQLA